MIGKGEKMIKFWNDYPAIIEELDEIKRIIKQNIKSRERF